MRIRWGWVCLVVLLGITSGHVAAHAPRYDGPDARTTLRGLRAEMDPDPLGARPDRFVSFRADAHNFDAPVELTEGGDGMFGVP